MTTVCPVTGFVDRDTAPSTPESISKIGQAPLRRFISYLLSNSIDAVIAPGNSSVIRRQGENGLQRPSIFRRPEPGSLALPGLAPWPVRIAPAAGSPVPAKFGPLMHSALARRIASDERSSVPRLGGPRSDRPTRPPRQEDQRCRSRPARPIPTHCVRRCRGPGCPSPARSCSSARRATWPTASSCRRSTTWPGAGTCPSECAIVGFARRDWTDDDLRADYEKTLRKNGGPDFREIWPQFASRLVFAPGNVRRLWSRTRSSRRSSRSSTGLTARAATGSSTWPSRPSSSRRSSRTWARRG